MLHHYMRLQQPLKAAKMEFSQKAEATIRTTPPSFRWVQLNTQLGETELRISTAS
jgi:hypothetical protein